MDIRKLDELFIEKLSEKYKLNERGLKQVLNKYDLSKDGLLDLDELSVLMKSLLNGFRVEDVENLVSRYDINGDGKLSFEELLHLVNNKETRADTSSTGHHDENVDRNRSRKQDAWEASSEISSSAPLSSRGFGHGVDDDVQSEAASVSTRSHASTQLSHISANDQYGIESRASLYLKNLRTLLLKRASQLRDEGKVNVQQRLSMHSKELMESIAKALLAKAFRPYAFIEGRPQRSDFCVSRGDFARVMRTFIFPGVPAPQTIVIDYLFLVCCSPSTATNTEKLASPTVFAGHVFPTPAPLATVAAPDTGVIVKDGRKVDRHEMSDSTLVPRRPDVGRGPVTNKDSCLPLAITDLPLKFISRKSRTSLVASTTLDSTTLNRSNALPAYECSRDHVFGFSSARQVNGAGSIYSLSSGVPSSSLKDDCLLYTSAAVGIVHDLKNNTQAFFDKHTDDISCISLCSPMYLGGRLVATGQNGKTPVLLVWTFKPTASGAFETKLLASIGEGFFQRMVVSIAFSFDGLYLAAVSGDDHHTMGIWDISNGSLVASAVTQNGIPPQIRSFIWAPSKVTTEWISSTDNVGPCDLLCSAGEHHLKFWSLARPSKGLPASLKSCGARLGKTDVTAPKSYLCADFIACDRGSFYDVVCGGSNGSVYLFRKGALTISAPVCKGPLTCLQVHGAVVICGGVGGVIKVLDARTLSSHKAFNVTEAVTRDIGGPKRPSSSNQQRGLTRARSLSAGPRRSSATSSRPLSGGFAVSQLASTAESASKSSDVTVTALTICEDRRSKKGPVLSVAATTSAGVTVLVDTEASSDSNSGAVSCLMYYHIGAVNGVARFPSNTEDSLAAVTCGDDKLICVWDTQSMRLKYRCKAQSAVLCCDVHPSSLFLAGGLSSGGLSILQVNEDNEGGSSLHECSFRKDGKEGISDVKFSPSGESLAAGSHDNFIYIYGCSDATPADRKGDRGEVVRAKTQFNLRPLHKLRGHSSYITHLDWSKDESILRSTCGAYELLLWDRGSGRLATGASESDIKWSTTTCVLGFSVMGIWPKYSDGTDINAVDVSKKKNLIATADDFGLMSILNYPCVVSGAPRMAYNGHSSHVSSVCFNGYYDEQLVSTGGQDCSVMVWRVA